MIYIFVEIKLLLVLPVTRYSELIYNLAKYRLIQPIIARYLAVNYDCFFSLSKWRSTKAQTVHFGFLTAFISPWSKSRTEVT